MNEPALDQRLIALNHLRAALVYMQQLQNCPLAVAAIELAIAAADPEMDFGAIVRQRRKEAGWTIPELAARVELTENTVRNIEAGRTTPAADSLAKLLRLPQLQLAATHALPLTPVDHRPNAHMPPRYDPAGMAQDLRAVVNGPGGTLEQSYLYLDNQSAADYLAVCDAYGAFRNHLFADLQRLADRIAAEVKLVDVVAIGSGDGRAEVCLTQALARQGRVAKLYLLDISHSLLAAANEHATRVLRPERVHVEAVHGNFHELQRYRVLHAGPGKPRRLYTLLGATLANLADELRFFRDLHTCSAPGDFALIDFQLAHEPPERDPTMQAGAIPKIFFDWHAGPLRRNNPEVRKIDMHPELHPGRMAGSYACVSVATATMADNSVRTYRVMSSARYHLQLLADAISGTGWSAVHSGPYDERCALMLLQRS